ncbi:FxsA family membrane protein [Streptomyces sp. NPDC006879]|uniref:FxsA family membrane protein n=1 Tax=Streptomyces sp. NPDC006879 TaxID=3364767 RepID=UPI0036736E3D
MMTAVPSSTTPKRSRARTLLPLAVAAWLVLEVWLLAQLAYATSGFVVFAVLVAGFVLGAVVIKRAGRRAFQNLAATLQQQQAAAAAGPPTATRGNGLLMLSGLLLMTPGLLSDCLGLALLIPPVRSWFGRRVARSLERRVTAAGSSGPGEAYQQARMHRPGGKVVQGEVIRDSEPSSGSDSQPQTPRPPLQP